MTLLSKAIQQSLSANQDTNKTSLNGFVQDTDYDLYTQEVLPYNVSP
jgi:hypothetical protein